MEWERARKRRQLASAGGSYHPFQVQCGRGKEAVVFRCLDSSPEKPGQIVPPFLRGKCPLAPDLPFAQRSLVQWGFQLINIRPDLFPKIIALYVFGLAFPNALRPHRADIAISLFRIVNPPQPSGQPSKIPQLQFFPLWAAIQIVFLIVGKGRWNTFPTGL